VPAQDTTCERNSCAGLDGKDLMFNIGEQKRPGQRDSVSHTSRTGCAPFKQDLSPFMAHAQVAPFKRYGQDYYKDPNIAMWRADLGVSR
jgi:hypothetical protein